MNQTLLAFYCEVQFTFDMESGPIVVQNLYFKLCHKVKNYESFEREFAAVIATRFEGVVLFSEDNLFGTFLQISIKFSDVNKSNSFLEALQSRMTICHKEQPQFVIFNGDKFDVSRINSSNISFTRNFWDNEAECLRKSHSIKRKHHSFVRPPRSEVSTSKRPRHGVSTPTNQLFGVSTPTRPFWA